MMLLAFFIVPRQTGLSALLSSGLLPIVCMYAAVSLAQITTRVRS